MLDKEIVELAAVASQLLDEIWESTSSDKDLMSPSDYVALGEAQGLLRAIRLLCVHRSGGVGDAWDCCSGDAPDVPSDVLTTGIVTKGEGYEKG